MRKYVKRANAHLQRAEQYEAAGNIEKARAHFERAFEYEHGARHTARPVSFGTREYGTLTHTEGKFQTEDPLPFEEVPLRIAGRVVHVKLPAIGVGWSILARQLDEYQLTYKPQGPIAIDPATDLDDKTKTEIGFMVNKKGDHFWTKHDATSELGGTTKHFTVISWIPHPMDSQKRDYFVLRTG